ncbi:UNVERIFIED_CONTAM: hypothetical protein Sangu_1001700 [Sesamum angustifolium]|uniref:Uncharacterized protein n=1 Tax=Sesamum angustifolium TaxID=2727405 RepID=A0AAW2PH90_9LAMI
MSSDEIAYGQNLRLKDEEADAEDAVGHEHLPVQGDALAVTTTRAFWTFQLSHKTIAARSRRRCRSCSPCR